MKNENARTISIRTNIEIFAKARDGLLTKGIPPEKLATNSSIMKTALLLCCTLTEDPKGPASQESIELIKQLWKATKREKSIDLGILE